MAALDYDVVVAGGGTAGSIAAIAAARMGKRAAVFEKGISLGGSIVMGQVIPEMTLRIPGVRDNSGINRMIKAALCKTGDAYSAAPQWYNPEAYSRELERLCRHCGVSVFFDTPITGIRMAGGVVTELTAFSSGTSRRVSAPVVIDATGNADIAHMAGVDYLCGDEDGYRQPMSRRFLMGGIDMEALRGFFMDIASPISGTPPMLEIAYVRGGASPFGDRLKQGVLDGLLEPEDIAYIQAFSVPNMWGTLSFNCPEWNVQADPLDPAALSRMCMETRLAAGRMAAFFKARVGGCENAFVAATAQLPGVRESRRIKGSYTLTREDMATKAKFADAIAQSAYPVDVHGQSQTVPIRFEQGEFAEVPYRCLTQDRVGNLLVCGRTISVDFVAQSALRIQPVCKATGEAAGIAAALAAGRTPVNAVDGAAVRTIMRDWGGQFAEDTGGARSFRMHPLS